jgi:hypothetical protein
MLIGDNLVLGVLFYGAIAWSVGALVVATFVATMLYARTYYDHSETTGARAWGWVRRWALWQACRRLYRHDIQDAGYAASGRASRGVPCLFAATPHGVNSWSFFLTFMAQGPESVGLGRPVVAALSWLLAVPILREFLLAMGAVTVDASTLRHMLTVQRRSVALIPNGTREIAPSRKVPPPNRTGFLRLAYELNATAKDGDAGAVDVVYVYMENEDRVYTTWGNEWRLRQWMLNTLGFTLTPYIGPVPFRHPLVTHIGPRHVYQSGESYDAYKARWDAGVASLRRAAAVTR